MMAKEIFNVEMMKVTCVTDSKSLYENLQSTHIVEDSRIRVDIARIKEMIEVGEVEMKWVPTAEQLADPMTKQGASAHRLMEVLGNGQLKC